MINPTYIYSTASNVAAFINGYHIEQAYGFNFKESVPKVPIYGYNDYKYSKAVTGKGIVQGILVVNFMFPGYLNGVIEQSKGAYVPKLYNYKIGHGASTEKSHQESLFNKLKTEIPPNTPELKTARAEYIVDTMFSKTGRTLGESMALEAKRQILIAAIKSTFSELLLSSFSDFGNGESASLHEVMNSPLDAKQHASEGCRIDLYYQDPDFVNWYVTFNNVYFTEVSQSASQAGAEGSSEPLYEIYQFIASDRKIKILR
jgi:hypothetical protein